MKNWLIVALLSFTLFNCTGPRTKVLNLIEQGTGDQYEVVKGNTNVDGYAVYRNERTGEFLAINYSAYKEGMTYDQFVAAAGPSYGSLAQIDTSHFDWVWVPNAIFDPISQTYSGEFQYQWIISYDYVGHGFTFEESSSHLKDLETLGAKLDSAQITTLTGSLSSQYGLSEARAEEVARLVSNWSSLAKTRAMSEADLTDFSTQILGADLASFQRAYEKSVTKNDPAELNALVRQAAETNGVSVEHARKILKSFMQ